jgi:FKBP-type peptidyl-prolyl cis-trans isomerase FkpA
MRFSLPLAAACAAILSLSACGGGGGSNGGPASVVSSPDALKTLDTTVGTGAVASAGARVQVNYSGYLYSATAADFKGMKFQSSTTPFTFVVGAVNTSESAIPGFSQGVQGMKVGGKRTILVPSGLAYGTQGVSGVIPPNSGVVFDVELVKVCGASAC